MGGLSQSTASGLIKEGYRENQEKILESSTGKRFRVIERIGINKNDNLILEISE